MSNGVFFTFGTILQKSGAPFLWDLKIMNTLINNNKKFSSFMRILHSVSELRQTVIKCYLIPFEKPGASLMMLFLLGEKCVPLSMKDLSSTLPILSL